MVKDKKIRSLQIINEKTAWHSLFAKKSIFPLKKYKIVNVRLSIKRFTFITELNLRISKKGSKKIQNKAKNFKVK